MRPDRPRPTSWQLHTSVFVSFLNSRPSSPSTDSTFISFADTSRLWETLLVQHPSKTGPADRFFAMPRIVSVHSAEVSSYNSCLPSSDVAVIACKLTFETAAGGCQRQEQQEQMYKITCRNLKLEAGCCVSVANVWRRLWLTIRRPKWQKKKIWTASGGKNGCQNHKNDH